MSALQSPLTAGKFEEVSLYAGRNAAPSLLFDAYCDGRVSPDVLRAVLVGVWVGAEWPLRTLPRWIWLTWFRAADYPKPARPLTLYRGATPAHARGMSWTLDRDHAEYFAHRFDGLGGGFRQGFLYCATVEPEGILAVVDQLYPDGRKEHEVVVDSSMLPHPVRRAEA